MRRRWVIGVVWIVIGGWGGLASPAWGATTPTQIYRSVGPGTAAALVTGGAALQLTITANNWNAYISTVYTPTHPVGVGDVIQYDSGGGKAAVIISRQDDQHLTVSSSSGGTPTAVYSCSSWNIFRAYTSLKNAAIGTVNPSITVGLTPTTPRNLVSNNEDWNFACYADADDIDAVDWPNTWTTAPGNYIRIYTPYRSSDVGPSQRHSGYWDESKYHLFVTNDNCLVLETGCAVVEGLQFHSSAVAAGSVNCVDLRLPGGSYWVFKNLFRGEPSNTGSDRFGINVGSGQGSSMLLAYNNIFYNFQGVSDCAAMNSANSLCAVAFDNNTVVNSWHGIVYSNGTITAKNVLMQNMISDGFGGPPTSYGAGSDYNLVDKGNTFGAHSRIASGVLFLDPAAGNYHLSGGDTLARYKGGNLTSEGMFTDDIDGDPRPAAGAWDIGADQDTLPTFTKTATPTRTPTPTRTVTQTATLSPTISATYTQSATYTVTQTRTPTPTISATITTSPSQTPFVTHDVVVYPQPAVGNQVNFYYLLEAPAQVHFEIFNVMGELVAHWDEDHAAVGYAHSPWAIRSVAPGVYLFRLRIHTAQSERTTAWKKLVIVKK